MFIYWFVRKHIKFPLALLLFFPVFCSFVSVAQTSEYSSKMIDNLKQPVAWKTKTGYNWRIVDNLAASTKYIALEKESPIKNLTTLINIYCASILSAWTLTDGESLYSPKQSAFVYLLCTNMQSDFSKFYDSAFTWYFKVSAFDKLGLPVNKDKKYLADEYVDDLFNNIIDEYFNIKQANVYWMTTPKEADLGFDKQADAIFSWYFNAAEVCNSANTKKLYSKKVCAYMTKYIKNAAKVMDKLNILNVAKMFENKKVQSCSSADPAGYDMMLCGLFGGSEKSLKPFVGLVYNELFYYNLFVKYFGNRLIGESNTLQANVQNYTGTIKRTAKEEQQKRLMTMEMELNWAQDSISMSLRILRNAYTTYPLHIGFLMYREKLQEFGNAMAKIATPVYTLYDKFRNVQCLK